MATLWHGRFEGGPAEALQALNDSLPFDRRMFRDDIAGSRAHARMLAAVGLLSVAERDAVLDALDTVEVELDDGSFAFERSDEDIHTAVERRVTELAGPAGAKLHTGRSRNDQVATDLRLLVRRELTEIAGLVLGLQRTLLARADEAIAAGWYLPGYTHLQQAQPVALAHHLLAHGWALARDVDRVVAARRPRRRVAAGRRGARRIVAAAGPRGDRRRARVRRSVRQQPRRRIRPRLRRRRAARAGPHRRAPVTPGRGAHLVVVDRVRIHRARRRLLDRFVDDAPEEEPRHRRVGPGQGREVDRPPHRVPRHPEGAPPRLQQGPAGGQGTPLPTRSTR